MAETNREENISKPQWYSSNHLYFKNKVFESPAEENFHYETWLGYEAECEVNWNTKLMSVYICLLMT